MSEERPRPSTPPQRPSTPPQRPTPTQRPTPGQGDGLERKGVTRPPRK